MKGRVVVKGSVADWKTEEVKSLRDMIESSPVVGVVDLQSIPAKQLQNIREDLRGKVTFRMSKNNLMKIALEKTEKESLKDYIGAGAAFIFSNENPFKIYRLLLKSKSPAPAKPGDIAKTDIVLHQGSTGLPPGPLVSELQSLGVPAKIDKGSISIERDTVFVKHGETISKKVSEILSQLKIEPMEVGANLTAAFEEGLVFKGEVLSIDDVETRNNIIKAFSNALALTFDRKIFTKHSVKLLIQQAAIKTKSLAIGANIVSPETIGPIMSKSVSQVLSLSKLLNSAALDDDLKNKLNVFQSAAPTEKKVAEHKIEEAKDNKDKDGDAGLEGLGALFG
ncbi:MAG: 50S ribosomal protein L10 [Candidatus Methanofastidiosum methylothiophilum]|jgi:large subunit ribosomal protein L10|uniref:Large ribosomal subunit protein uL10 n=1 Tax=Candidatus Methanofastidiosum methylothiophilum TaxID=1705564 RepID=A0A150JJU7_9EURY|nr:MAG: 50S ribosomal protein L10 [Candidatus Methanofastidiosum methylthiophilus]MBP6931922.1 50S ribosomal protein L10 [Methanofastidiosum sp.]OQC52127.1 MAG: 50S ribosomal protein L10 [Euryarchaeota archaeon ADurb.Bin023]KYC57154.1 MAG: 50S ribosomal protein L10 [Candidatus Methanofastidiosum methylthiophilus]KYC57910.1 MAG: 50S ribosomal protein L10 [Candidatus Methanofastidiosum methylthiophilus]